MPNQQFQHKTVDPNRGSGRFLHGPNNPNLSNEPIMLAPIDVGTYPNGLPSGTVVAKITSGGSSGQWGPYEPAAADGRQLTTAVALLYHDAPAATVAQSNVIVAREAVVNGNLITYAAAASTNEKAAAEAGLAANHVMVRR
jgi:hypothetical protein